MFQNVMCAIIAFVTLHKYVIDSIIIMLTHHFVQLKAFWFVKYQLWIFIRLGFASKI